MVTREEQLRLQVIHLEIENFNFKRQVVQQRLDDQAKRLNQQRQELLDELAAAYNVPPDAIRQVGNEWTITKECDG